MIEVEPKADGVERYEITRWEVVVTRELGKQRAELVGYDKDGNEYRVEHRVWVNNEFHEVEPTWICTVAHRV